MPKNMNCKVVCNACALYMRLSKEDNKKSESQSIENQRKILRQFADYNNFEVYDEYIDDGYTGTDMNRPGLLRLMQDIKTGLIDIVITKDFSRLGRNTGQVMTMLDNFFAGFGVRYISVAEGIDTERSNNSLMLAPVFSFISEMYSGDISRKINSAFKVKMELGECIAPMAPYGYKKDARNKNHLIPDKESAKTVQEIFLLAKSGWSPKSITDKLNKDQILTPSEYKSKKGKYNHKVCSNWSVSTVRKILNNEVYLGNMVQGKTHRTNFKSKAMKNIPKSQWFKVERTHNALIDKETWDIVRGRLKSRNYSSKKGFKNAFSNIAFCADCGKSMSIVCTDPGKYKYGLICGGYKQFGRKVCTRHYIDYNILEGIVSEALKGEISDEINITENSECLNQNNYAGLINRVEISERVKKGNFEDTEIKIFVKFPCTYKEIIIDSKGNKIENK